jgi:hypothetical protein
MPFVAPSYAKNQRMVSLGYQPQTGDHLLIPNIDRYSGTYILGVQGSGKSGLLQNLIAKDMQNGHAVIEIDAHGDLTSAVISQVPAERLGDTYLLDMEDEAYPFGVNILNTGKLTSGIDNARMVERLMHIFEILWPEVLSQQNLPRYVRAAIYTLLANPGTTLVDMQTLLEDQSYRAKLLANVTEPTVTNFWHNQYDNLGPHEQYRRVQPLIGRLESLFMGRSLVRNIVGQRRTTINFRKAIEAKQIILIKLPVKQLKQDARLIGTILLSQISNAVFSFADVPEANRPGFSLIVDEFQHFATSDFAELLTEGRKFGVRVTVAHQYRNQLPGFLQQSTMTARTKVTFQLTPEDAREMAHVFPSPDSTIKPDDITDNPVGYLLHHPSDDPVIRTFTETYLQPLQGHKRGAGRIEITNRGAPSVYEVLSGGRTEHVRVADPTHQLNLLLREVMLRGNPEVPLTPDIIRGFSNCGVGFYKAAMSVGPRDILLKFDTKFPRHLVVLGTDGEPTWTRKPENGNEQLYHFVFHLRLLMMSLADNPIGKATTTSSSEVAKMLTSLPKRAAFVRTADTTGVIFTHDTPPMLADYALRGRVHDIIDHTRYVYCHPKAEVEKSFLPVAQPVAQAQPASRWEEVE